MKNVTNLNQDLTLVMLVFQLGFNETWKSWKWADYFYHCVYPTNYTYIHTIMILYIPFFFLVRLNRPKLICGLAIALIIPYLLIYVHTLPAGGIEHLKLGMTNPWLWMIFYFQMMLAGGYCAFRPDRYLKSSFGIAALLAVALGAYIGLKFAMVVTGCRIPGTGLFLSDFYGILILLTLIIVLLMFQLFTADSFRLRLARIKPLNWLVVFIGSLTLEIYLIHEFVAYNACMAKISFPANILIWAAATLIASWIVASSMKYVRHLFSKN